MHVLRKLTVIAAIAAAVTYAGHGAAHATRAQASPPGVATPTVFPLTTTLAAGGTITEVSGPKQAEVAVETGSVPFGGLDVGTATGSPPGLLWVAYAKEAVSWTTPAAGTGTPITLTQTQLAGIYNCTIRTWNQVGGTSTAPIVPVLPQASSGTRAFFLGAIGVTTPGTCVINGVINIPGDPHNPLPIQENTGVSPTDSSGNYLTGNAYEFANNPYAIFPYSAGDWIGQEPPPAGGGHGNSATWAPGVLTQPREVSGVSPILTHPGSIDTINPSFSSTFTRVVWNVMANAGTQTAPKIPASLVPEFGPSGTWCSGTAIVRSYGFLAIGHSCGTFFETSPGTIVSGGSISGTVENDSGTPLSGITVHACLANTATCSTATTDTSGFYWVSGLANGTYVVDAQDSPLLPGHAGPITIANASAQSANLVLIANAPFPQDIHLPGANGNGPPIVHWQNPTPFSVSPRCANGVGSWAVTQNGAIIASGPLVEIPKGSGVYYGTLPKFAPNNHGYALLKTSVFCPDGTTETEDGNIFIDPSGMVVSPTGTPIGGATVTLMMASSPSGPFTPVPNNSTIMSPANRTNPVVTTADGHFGWDVQPGYYEVQATRTGCHTPTNPQATTVTTPVLPVPPPATGLVLTLDCSSSLAPSVTSADHTTFTAGTAGTFTITTTGTPLPTLSETGQLPTGVTFTPHTNGTATLSVTAAATAQTFTFNFSAANGVGSAVSELFTLTINPAPPAPAITSADHATFTAGTAGTFTVTATGTPAPALQVNGTLPTGVTFTDNGGGSGTLAVGTSAAAGSYMFTLTATNSAGPQATQSFSLVILAPAPAITSAASATFTLTSGVGGTVAITATGSPVPALSESGTLPTGVTFTDNGNGTATLAVAPGTASGTTKFTITATNGTTTTQTFTLTIS